MVIQGKKIRVCCFKPDFTEEIPFTLRTKQIILVDRKFKIF